MRISTSTNSCARNEEMVTYLYGEATRDEAKEFEKHLQNCSSCRSELATFGDVREAMGEWRQQALGSLTSPALEAHAARHFAPAAASTRRRSAIAALREFFTLSPTWMRAATAVAALVFCALAAIAVAYFVQKPQTVVVETQAKSGYSEKEVESKIAAAIEKQKASQVKDAPTPSPERPQVARNEQPKVTDQVRRNTSGAIRIASNNRKQQAVPRTLARSSKTELASTDFLPFTAPGDEESLPSLTDLVDDDN
jgi:Putative zinc-finger